MGRRRGRNGRLPQGPSATIFPAMSTFANVRKRALARVLEGLNRADEIGGEVRDFVVERVLEDERYIKMRKRIAQMRGKSYTSKAEAAEAEAARQRAAAEAAPAPSAGQSDAEEVIADPGLQAQIYGKTSCPWSGRAIRLLEDLKIDYDFIDLDDPDNEHYQTRLIPETKQNTVPYVFVRGHFIGGFNALDELNRTGKLEYLVMTPEQRETANPALANLEIAPRPNSDEVSPGESS